MTAFEPTEATAAAAPGPREGLDVKNVSKLTTFELRQELTRRQAFDRFFPKEDMRVSYDVSHDFGSRKTNVKLTANSHGTTVGAEVDDRELKEVSAQRNLDIADQKVDTEASWLVKAQTARVKLMSALGDDSVSATVDYDTNSGESAVEVGYSTDLSDSRSLSATLTPASKDLEVELVDSGFESGATWTATATANLEDAAAAKVTLKRSWAW